MNRRDKDNYYLDVAETILKRASCLRRNFGAVIVRNDEIISCGYTGAPRGRMNCVDIGNCTRAKLNIPKGQRYEMCRSVHAETNAVIHSSRECMLGANLYLVGIEYELKTYVKDAMPCSMCKRIIINAGIQKVIVRYDLNLFSVYSVENWVKNDESVNEISGY